MATDRDKPQSLFGELKRRNVYRVGLAYIILAWLTLQILDVVIPVIEAPDWVARIFLVVLAIGFPIAILFSWAYELTPDGLMRQKDIDRTQSITGETGQRLDSVIIGIFIISIVFLVADRMVFSVDTATAVAPPQTREQPSIAVLPFTNMSSDESSGHFSDGLADTLLHRLAQVGELRVAARTSSFRFRDNKVDIGTIAQQLNVANILEGSVQKSGKTIRVTAQLINASDGYHLWSGAYDRPFEDIFAIQDEIAGEVVAALKISLLGADEQRLQHHATDNIEAYTAYLLGIQDASDYSFEGLPRALEHLQLATELDPNYALAYAAQVRAYMDMSDIGLISEERMLELAIPINERALELDPNLPSAVALAAVFRLLEYFDADVESIFQRAVELGPNNADAREYYGTFLHLSDRNEEALAVISSALLLDPLSLQLQRAKLRIHSAMQQSELALATAARMREINSQAPHGYYLAGFEEFGNGNWAEGILWFVRSGEVDPHDPEIPVQIGDWYLDLYLYDEAELWYQHAFAVDPEQPMVASSMLVKPLHDRDYEETRRMARELLIANIDDRNGSRQFALMSIAHSSDASGDYTEFLSWAERFEPQLFEQPPTGVADNLTLSARIGHALRVSGKTEQGDALTHLALQEQEKLEASDGIYFRSLYVAAATGDVETTQEKLRLLAETPLRVDGWDYAFEPAVFLKPYFEDPIFVKMQAVHRAHAMQQLEALKALNGGSYPLPRFGPRTPL